MSLSLGAPQQLKQPSRKGKRAWRKNVDISDVQQGLETLREEIIQGGPLAEKPSEELFALDTQGSEKIKKKYKVQKPLKIDEILTKRSAVPALDSRKRPHAAVTDGILEPASKKAKPDWVSKKEVQRLKNNINAVSHLNTEIIESEVSSFDLWSDGTSATQDTKPGQEYVPKPRPKVAPPTIKHPPLPMTASGKPVPAVKEPDAGASYNPTFEDWDELLNREGAKELEAEKKRLREAQAAAEREARIRALADAPETSAADDESAWEGFETEHDDPEVLEKKRPKRKTPAQRNKAKRRKEAERIAKHEKRMREKQTQAEQILSALIDRDQEERLELAREAQAEGAEEGDDRTLRRRKRGNAAIPEKSLEVVLPDELQESLRRLKPEGNLLNERFRTLLVNGKLEARKPVLQPKKKRVKFTEKWSYKDFSIKV
ncbi:hypothetical protein A1O1_02848 [Capronia coronata CBS 617.96]|uniref:Ribosome biogenesis protein NOP53 n=1 Tax=Capronia coronata CBS 617.96 TaxID=1182541 RepID=W9YNH1_9EURO|nr:uncharacterized protein A1O1_02848 [Capronia coronata CBS 617.96]EXJ94452.1 hypothetical protein A1O1_02848 [Capronia coronata CBS 617.96]